MATARPFAYNTGAGITGTDQVGSLAVGTPTVGFSATGLEWWNGPDEDLGYVIAASVPSDTQPTQVPDDAITLSTVYKGTDITLSNNNQTASQVFSYQQTVLGQTLISGTDKVMFSVQYTSTNPSVGVGGRFIGVGLTGMDYQGDPFNGYPGNDTNSIGFSDDGNYYYNGSVGATGLPTWTTGDIIDIAISSGQGWFIRVNGGDWNNNPAANPTTLNGYLPMNGLTNFYPALCPYIYGTMQILNYPKYGVPTDYNFLGNVSASVGFFRSSALTAPSFISIANVIAGPSGPFASASSASSWLTTNGYWNSWLIDGSILFPTLTNSYVRANTAITLGVGNFTVEGWVYMTSNPASNRFVLVGGSGNRGITIYNGTYGAPNSTQITIDYETAGDYQFTVPTMVANTWYYIAVSRNASNSMSLWLNGVRAGNSTLGFNFISNNYSIGGWPTQGQYSSNAYISNVRMTTTNVYDVNSLTIPVPITNFTNVPGTQLLMNTKFGATWLVDSSPNNITMVAYGSPSSSNYEPFTPIP